MSEGENQVQPIRFDCPGRTIERFFKSSTRRRVIMGPFGSAKSTSCCMEIYRRATEQAPNAQGIRKTRWAIVRNSYPDLKNTTVKTWRDWFGDQFGAFNNVAPFVHHMKFRLPDNTRVDCEVIFLALDDEKDAKKFLSLEVTGIYFNEVRELKRAIIESGDGRLGRYPSMKDGGPTWYGMIADTNMPDEDHWLYDLAEGAAVEGWEFFRQPGAVMKVDGEWKVNPQAENLKNLAPGYYSGQLTGKTDAWISVHLASEYGRLPIEGSYFAEELADLERRGRITEISGSPDLPVHTAWDIGMHDYMTIWFFQLVGDETVFLAYYENNGKALDHYAQVMKEMQNRERWTWGSHLWPHDGFHKDVGILGAKTRAEVFQSLGFSLPIKMEKRTNPGEWIDGTRLFLRKSRFNRVGCKDGLNHLRRYTRRHDSVRNVYLNQPQHDEHSHGADGFQIAAMGRGRVSNTSATWSEEILNFEFKYAG